MLICPEASSAQNNMAAVSADGNTVCVLILGLNSSCSRIALVVRTLRHWLGGRRVKVNKRSPTSSRLSATARCLSLHLDEGLAARLDLLRRHCVDHAVVIRSDLVMQPLGACANRSLCLWTVQRAHPSCHAGKVVQARTLTPQPTPAVHASGIFRPQSNAIPI